MMPPEEGTDSTTQHNPQPCSEADNKMAQTNDITICYKHNNAHDYHDGNKSPIASDDNNNVKCNTRVIPVVNGVRNCNIVADADDVQNVFKTCKKLPVNHRSGEAMQTSALSNLDSNYLNHRQDHGSHRFSDRDNLYRDPHNSHNQRSNDNYDIPDLQTKVRNNENKMNGILDKEINGEKMEEIPANPPANLPANPPEVNSTTQRTPTLKIDSIPPETRINYVSTIFLKLDWKGDVVGKCTSAVWDKRIDAIGKGMLSVRMVWENVIDAIGRGILLVSSEGSGC